MEVILLLLASLIAVMLSLQLWALSRSRPEHVRDVEASLLRIDTRLDEQGRLRAAESRALREEVGKRLTSSSDRSERTYADVIKRLALVDQAQAKITELSSDVVSLRQILADRSSRGAFGEVQLEALVTDILPPGSYQTQYTLSNGKRADCMLFLPQPTGNLAIDAKFPLSNYRRKVDPALAETDRRQAADAFVRDVQKHINDIADKYIVPGETCASAVLFLPAEAVFADIHASCPQLVDLAHRRRVMLTSPTTLMAVLTTAASVLKDSALQQRAQELQHHLRALGQDFDRFEARMDKLADHIRLAGDDMANTRVSAGKISSRFRKIDRLELGEPTSGAAVEP